MFFKIRSRTYTVPDKFWNGQKLTHTRLSFTQDPRNRASFLKQTSTVLQSVTEFTRNPCKRGLL